MTFQELRETIIAAGYEPESYSGRGMYGAECISFDTKDGTTEVVANLMESATVSDPILAHAIRQMKTDALGLGTVYYWPKIKWEQPS